MMGVVNTSSLRTFSIDLQLKHLDLIVILLNTPLVKYQHEKSSADKLFSQNVFTKKASSIKKKKTPIKSDIIGFICFVLFSFPLR